MNRPFSVLTSALCLTVLTGCAGSSHAPQTTGTGDYEWVTPLGSNVPVRVPKGQSAANAVSPTATLSGEQAANVVSASGGGSVSKTGAR